MVYFLTRMDITHNNYTAELSAVRFTVDFLSMAEEEEIGRKKIDCVARAARAGRIYSGGIRS